MVFEGWAEAKAKCPSVCVCVCLRAHAQKYRELQPKYNTTN